MNFYADQSRAREFFTMRLVHEPGTYYEYDPTANSMIIYVVRHAIWRREPGLDFTGELPPAAAAPADGRRPP